MAVMLRTRGASRLSGRHLADCRSMIREELLCTGQERHLPAWLCYFGGSPSQCHMAAIHRSIVLKTNSTVRVLLHPLRRLPGKESEEPEQQKRGQPSGHVIR